MKRRGRMLILFSSVFLIAGCTDELVTTEQKKVEVQTATHTNQTKHAILNPSQYERLFKYMNEHLEMDQFQLKVSTIGADFTVVDQSLSFGKGRWLTVDGTIDTPSTQEAVKQVIHELKNVPV